MGTYLHRLDFESALSETEAELEMVLKSPEAKETEIIRLKKKIEQQLQKLYLQLTPWQKVLVARHPNRPKATDYIQQLMQPFFPLSGDRAFGEDHAMIGGLGHFAGQTVMVLGQEKGHDMESRLKCNFGMPHPEGYRKAARLMTLADRFGFPILCFVDTPGAYAGEEAEKRGQSQAIAACIETSLNVSVPVISVIIGEGGSGGAIALATGNHVMMLEHSVYSVISPEGCASILWRTRDKKEEAALAQKLTAEDLHRLGIVDAIVQEPLGGAHRHPKVSIEAIGQAIADYLHTHAHQPRHWFKQQRQERFLNIGRALAS